MKSDKEADSRPGETETALHAAAQRLGAALDGLDGRSAALLAQISQAREAGEVDKDRARLAAELDNAEARADALETAAREAGVALDNAIEQVRLALGDI